MTTIELKNFLHHRITDLNDKSFLNAIKTFIETNSESATYKTTAEQRKKIQEGREQIIKGECFTNEQVEMEMDKWLEEK